MDPQVARRLLVEGATLVLLGNSYGWIRYLARYSQFDIWLNYMNGLDTDQGVEQIWIRIDSHEARRLLVRIWILAYIKFFEGICAYF